MSALFEVCLCCVPYDPVSIAMDYSLPCHMYLETKWVPI